jgi:hypothetical protein
VDNKPIDRPTGNRDYNLPQGPLRISGATRSLTGDVRTVAKGTTAMLVDVEYDTPRALFISLRATAPVNGSVMTWRIRSGLDRASSSNSSVDMNVVSDTGTDAINRFVIARSLQVLVEYGATQPSATIECTAVVTPMDITIDAADIFRSSGGITAGVGNENVTSTRNGNPDSAQPASIAQDAAVAHSVDEVLPVAPSPLVKVYGIGRRTGITLYNDSASPLWLCLGGIAAANNFTCLVPAGAYYETPFGYSGGVSILWSAAGAGFARITAVGYAGEL